MVISANPEKVDKVKTWPVPNNPKELCSILGVVVFIIASSHLNLLLSRNVYTNLSVPPITKKSKKGKPVVNQTKEKFNWTGKCQEALVLLNLIWQVHWCWVIHISVKPFVLVTDISLQEWVLYYLKGMKNGKDHFKAYASWFIHPNEQSMKIYTSTKLELLVMKWAVTAELRD